MKLLSVVFGLTTLLSPHCTVNAAPANELAAANTGVATGVDLQREMLLLKASLDNIQAMINTASLEHDPEVMDKAAKLFRRAMNLVKVSQGEQPVRKAKVVGVQHDSDSPQLRGGKWSASTEDETNNQIDETQRNLYDSTITFPECEEKFLADCLTIINKEMADLELDCEIVIHEKRSIAQEGYNKVVIVTNLQADMVKGRNNDGIVSYPFMWDDAETGLKSLGVDGKWDCSTLTPEECCSMIKLSVPHADAKGNHIQCHIFVPFGGIGNKKRTDRVFVNLSQDGRVQEAPVVS